MSSDNSEDNEYIAQEAHTEDDLDEAPVLGKLIFWFSTFAFLYFEYFCSSESGKFWCELLDRSNWSYCVMGIPKFA